MDDILGTHRLIERRSAAASSVGANSARSAKRATSSADEREFAADGPAARRADGVCHVGLSERAEEAAQPLADPGRLGLRRPSDPVEADRAAVGEPSDPRDGVGGRNLDEAVPVPQHFQQRDLGRAQPLVATLGSAQSGLVATDWQTVFSCPISPSSSDCATTSCTTWSAGSTSTSTCTRAPASTR